MEQRGTLRGFWREDLKDGSRKHLLVTSTVALGIVVDTN